MTITVETIVQELQRVPVDRLEEVYQLIHTLASTRPSQNEDIIQRSRELTEAFSEWSADDWAAFDADLKQTRAELFNRPEPEL